MAKDGRSYNVQFPNSGFLSLSSSFWLVNLSWTHMLREWSLSPPGFSCVEEIHGGLTLQGYCDICIDRRCVCRRTPGSHRGGILYRTTFPNWVRISLSAIHLQEGALISGELRVLLPHTSATPDSPSSNPCVSSRTWRFIFKSHNKYWWQVLSPFYRGRGNVLKRLN